MTTLNKIYEIKRILFRHSMKKKHVFTLFSLDSPKNWTEDYKHENGNYINKCIKCEENFLGHKRRFICKECFKLPY